MTRICGLRSDFRKRSNICTPGKCGSLDYIDYLNGLHVNKINVSMMDRQCMFLLGHKFQLCFQHSASEGFVVDIPETRETLRRLERGPLRTSIPRFCPVLG